MANPDICCLSDIVSDRCHTKRFRANESVHKINILSKEELDILYLRVPNLKEIEYSSICDYHYRRYLSFYSFVEDKCCDPWKKHSKQLKVNLKIVDFQFSNVVKKFCNLSIVPGKKICFNCNTQLCKEIESFKEQFNVCIDPFQRHRHKVNTDLYCLEQQSIDHLKNIYSMEFSFDHKICSTCRLKLSTDISDYRKSLETASEPVSLMTNKVLEESDIESNISPFSQSPLGSEYQTNSQNKRKLDDMLDTFGITPFKRQKLNDYCTVNKGVAICQNILNQVSEAFEIAHDVKLPKFENIEQMFTESSWFKKIISNIQTKFNAPSTKFDEKIALLTLLPDDWKCVQLQKYFQCSPYMFNEARKLRANIGVLGKRVRKSYIRYSPEIRKEIEEFYLHDSNSSICSGSKECIKLKIPGQPSIEVQKRMLLYDLKDLYTNWIKETTYATVPCLAFFSQLKPKQCLFPGEPGTHNICVCQVHQNVKLKLAALKSNVSYKELIAASVCSDENKNCMLRKCTQCPTIDLVYQLLSSNTGINKMINVTYNIWTSITLTSKDQDISSIGRLSLVEFNEPFNDLLKSTSENIFNITEHHFISSKQKEHYSQNRKQLEQDTGVICMDFAENYSFIAQNSIQGFYFNNVQATLFTAALYYQNINNDDISCKSFCVISDSMIHQAYSIHAFQEAILHEIKTQFPQIKYITYYSDGAPMQFKNKNHLINVCYHEKDFGIKIKSYNFFGTSHGKSAADGIGAAAKRQARKLALQGICIVNAKQLYDHLSEINSDIKYLYVSDKEVVARSKKLNSRFNLAKTIKNTRKYHCFEPIDEQTMRVKLYSLDTESLNVKMI